LTNLIAGISFLRTYGGEKAALPRRVNTSLLLAPLVALQAAEDFGYEDVRDSETFLVTEFTPAPTSEAA